MHLINLPVDSKAQVLSLKLDSKDLNRLNELGITIGTVITCLRETPFNGPRVYQVGNSVLSIDRSLAQAIEVQKEISHD